MNENKAIEQDLIFHGAFSHDKETIKAKAKELRALGYRAVVITTYPSRYSRSHFGPGYSVYVSSKYFDDMRKNNIGKEIATFATRRNEFIKQQKKDLAAFDKKHADLVIELETLNSK